MWWLITLLSSPPPRPLVFIETPIYVVAYSEVLEQPLWLAYSSTNRPQRVRRAGQDFYVDSVVHTSDGKDYARNVWDKGHLAPAASFNDTRTNLYLTFNYLNSALQHQDLNRGAWRLLEMQERRWDDREPLQVVVWVVFSARSRLLPSGATVPDGFHKHIRFVHSGTERCWYFPNKKPARAYAAYEEPECRHERESAPP